MAEPRPLRRRIETFLGACIDSGELPGASWCVARGGRLLSAGTLGNARIEPRRRPAVPDTVYDLASLTKPLSTAALSVLLARQGTVDLRGLLAGVLPELRRSPLGGATLGDALLHRAGFPAWEPLFLFGNSAGDYLKRMARLAPVHGVVYSDPGYIAAGIFLERSAGSTLPVLFRRQVAAVLPGLADGLRFLPPRAWRARIAPTETGNRREAEMSRERHPARTRNYRGFRRDVIHGEVHDQNAFTLGGAAGHAGLFGTARAVAALAREFLPGSRLFQENELRLFSRTQASGGPERRTLGFQSASTPASPAHGLLSAEAFGHVGFTGTSVFIEPARKGIAVLLSNRIHPRFRSPGMQAIRREFLRIVAPALR